MRSGRHNSPDQVPNSFVAEVHVRTPPSVRLYLVLNLTLATLMILVRSTTGGSYFDPALPLGAVFEDAVYGDVVRGDVVREPAHLDGVEPDVAGAGVPQDLRGDVIAGKCYDNVF